LCPRLVYITHVYNNFLPDENHWLLAVRLKKIKLYSTVTIVGFITALWWNENKRFALKINLHELGSTTRDVKVFCENKKCISCC